MSGTPSSPLWRPLLTGGEAQRVFEAVEAIAADLRQVAGAGLDPGRGASLAGGLAGLALFFAYLDSVQPDEGHGDVAMELLEGAIETTGSALSFPSLYGGFSGVAWTLEHLRGRLFESEEEDPGDEVAAILAEHVGQVPWRQDYDLISGLTGLGVYALERLPRAHGMASLREVVARLAETSERWPEGGIAWRTAPALLPPRDAERFPEGTFNVGVAHGVPGTIAFLAGACAAGVEGRELLDGAVSWLLGQKLPPDTGSLFPYSVAPGHPPVPTRVAWCYGDLGVAAALLAAADAVGEEGWRREAAAIALQAAERPVEQTGVVDAGLCHGAAGNAHLFNRLHQATGDPRLAEAARGWIDQALGWQRPGQGVGGFQSWGPGEDLELRWVDDPGFLTGAAGIGLALLAAVSPVAPEWDRVLLVSLPAAS